MVTTVLKTIISVSQCIYESNRFRNKLLSVKECFYETKPYLKDIINDLKKSDTWKMQLNIAINFIFFKNNDQEFVIH